MQRLAPLHGLIGRHEAVGSVRPRVVDHCWPTAPRAVSAGQTRLLACRRTVRFVVRVPALQFSGSEGPDPSGDVARLGRRSRRLIPVTRVRGRGFYLPAEG